VYALNELASSITVLEYGAGMQALRRAQTVSTLSEDFDSLSVFSIAADDGTLAYLEAIPSGGRTSRHFELDPTGRWLLAANQNTNDIAFFRIDADSGRLIRTSLSVSVKSPVCVRILAS
jgi:6-phosphogluconolactonase